MKISWKAEAALDTRMQVQIEAPVELQKLTLMVPLPEQATKTKYEATKGKTKVEEEQNAVRWKFEKFHGKATLNITAKMLRVDSEVTSRRINASFFVINGGGECLASRVAIKTATTADKLPIFSRNLVQTRQYEVALK